MRCFGCTSMLTKSDNVDYITRTDRRGRVLLHFHGKCRASYHTGKTHEYYPELVDERLSLFESMERDKEPKKS